MEEDNPDLKSSGCDPFQLKPAFSSEGRLARSAPSGGIHSADQPERVTPKSDPGVPVKTNRRRVKLMICLVVCGIVLGLIVYEHNASNDARLAAPLYVAVQNNQLAKVESLLALGADPNRISFHSENVALESGQTVDGLARFEQQCRNLFDRLTGSREGDGNPLRVDEPNEPALQMAVENNCIPIVHALLKAGADPNTRVGESSVLAMAARQAAPQIVRELLQNGARVNPPAGLKDLTPLQWALRRGDAELSLLIIQSGAKTDVQDEQGRTPLMQAVSIGDPLLVKSLLDHGATVKAKNKFGLTALKIARMDGQEEIEQALERAGATE